MAASFDLKKTASGQFMFNLKAGNGEIILTSESYTTKDGAENGIESVKKNSQDDEMFERKESGDQFFFVLKAGNGQTIGRSERYVAKAGMENGIASVKKNAPEAVVKDNTEKEA